jgi:hypothetical protein
VESVSWDRHYAVITGAELEAYVFPPVAAVKDASILCDTCGRAAQTIHLLPWCVGTTSVEAACSHHDPGGYWFEVERLIDRPGDLFCHLASKNQRGDDHCVVVLIRWLDRAGMNALRLLEHS